MKPCVDEAANTSVPARVPFNMPAFKAGMPPTHVRFNMSASEADMPP